MRSGSMQLSTTNTNSSLQKFESIFVHSNIELANEELRLWHDCYEYLKKIIKSKSTLGEMTKVIQQDVGLC